MHRISEGADPSAFFVPHEGADMSTTSISWKTLEKVTSGILVHGGLGLFATLALMGAEPAPKQQPQEAPPAPQEVSPENSMIAGEDAAPTGSATQSSVKDMTEPLAIISLAKSARGKLDHYTCQMIKRELLAGKLQPEQTVDMVVRHEPFSVTLKWVKPRSQMGQEAVWVTGKHQGRMRVKLGGLLGAVGFLSLELHDKRVASTSRHAITEAGIANLIDRLHKDWTGFTPESVLTVGCDDTVFDNRACRRVRIEHPESAREIYEFAIAVTTFDKETHLPVGVECYGWPGSAGEVPHLVESYYYSQMKLNPGLDPAHFER